jgi:hypothetical protein
VWRESWVRRSSRMDGSGSARSLCRNSSLRKAGPRPQPRWTRSPGIVESHQGLLPRDAEPSKLHTCSESSLIDRLQAITKSG